MKKYFITKKKVFSFNRSNKKLLKINIFKNLYSKVLIPRFYFILDVDDEE